MKFMCMSKKKPTTMIVKIRMTKKKQWFLYPAKILDSNWSDWVTQFRLQTKKEKGNNRTERKMLRKRGNSKLFFQTSAEKCVFSCNRCLCLFSLFRGIEKWSYCHCQKIFQCSALFFSFGMWAYKMFLWICEKDV